MQSPEKPSPADGADVRRSRRFRVRLVASEATPAVDGREPSSREFTIYDLSRDGFLIDAAPHWLVEDRLSIDLPKVGTLVARIVRADRGMFGCTLIEPLTATQLDEAVSASRVVWPDFAGAGVWQGATIPSARQADGSPTLDDLDEPERWPRPVRTGIVVGSTLALWGLIALILW